MLKDYEIEDSKCVVCGDESNNRPLCTSCYNSYKRFFNANEDLCYCNKNIRYAMLKLFAYFDLLEDEEVDDIGNDDTHNGFPAEVDEHVRHVPVPLAGHHDNGRCGKVCECATH